MLYETKCQACGGPIRLEFSEDEYKLFGEYGLRLDSMQCDDCAERRERREAEAAAERRRALALERSRIPLEMSKWDAKLGNNALLDWVQSNAESSLFIAGPYGSGKTRAVCNVGARLVCYGRNVRYWLAGDLLAKLSRLYGDSFGQAETLVDSLKGCALLILNDLGKEKLTDRSGEALFRIIDARYEKALPTWITSNLNGAEIAAKMGDRGGAIRRRLKERYLAWNGGQVEAGKSGLNL